ncbi:MAG: hypothetical protein LWW94_08560 [Candidatus Desulfofervidaceae bacterium]|nr:hypothetical protein [Candidatus Desulfofervidaceae bacterium]
MRCLACALDFGRTGCPIGAGSMGLVGGFFALCMKGIEKGKETVKQVGRKVFRNN